MAQTESVKKSSNANKSSGTTTRKKSSSSSGKSTTNKSAVKNTTTKNTTTKNTTTKNTTTKNTPSKSTSRKSASGTRTTSTKKNPPTRTANQKVATTVKAPKPVEQHSVWEEYDFPVVREVIRWLLVAFSIILFISSFTQEGNKLIWLKKVNFGLFGWCGYVSVFLTIYLAFCVIPEIGRAKAWIRFISLFLVTSSVCGMMQIFCKTPLSTETTFAMYYAMGYEQGGGGVFGGVMVKLLYAWLGTVGMAVLLVALIICSVVLISKRSGMAFVKNTTSSIYKNVRSDIKQHRAESEIKKQAKKVKKQENKTKEVDDDDEAQWKQLEKAAALYASEQYEDSEYYEDLYEDKYEEEHLEEQDNVEENEGEQDSYVKSAVEKIRKRMARKKELEEEIKPLMEWNDTTEDTKYQNPVDYGEEKDKYSNTSGEDDARLAMAGTRTVVTASGKVITKESDSIPPATKKRTIPAKKNQEEQQKEENTISKEEKLEEENTYIPPKPYCFPSLDLLRVGDKKSSGKNQEKELRETAEILEQTFRDFGVGVTVTNYSCGPTVTRYELEPDHGVKVSRITALTDDIKLKLAATDLRMEAPIPGKAAVGIEVPNKENSTVMFRDLVESDAFQKHPSKVAFAVGKDIAGKVIVFDIAKMPHVLIAGATGSGKSVCINTLIMSILYKAEPSDVKLIMIDPKVVELSVYNGIPHLLIPVVTDPKKAAGALNWAVAEMTRRYQMFAETVTRDLAGYNRKARGIRAELEKEGLTPDKIEQEGPELLPQIVIIVDELADLMMVAPNEVEESICRLAQLARAAGIHLVLATQRPSVNVITGLIKANVPSRIAFSVSSGVDSRTILDMNGAEKLLGKGDMLFAPFGYNKPVRVQGAFVSDAEVSSVTDFIKQENGQVQIQEKSIKVDFSIDNVGEKEVESNRDEYFEKAAYFLIEKEKGSIGMLQRMFKVGFNRAARIMDQLAEAGVVGQEDGTKPRKVLMTKEEFEEFMENN